MDEKRLLPRLTVATTPSESATSTLRRRVSSRRPRKPSPLVCTAHARALPVTWSQDLHYEKRIPSSTCDVIIPLPSTLCGAALGLPLHAELTCLRYSSSAFLITCFLPAQTKDKHTSEHCRRRADREVLPKGEIFHRRAADMVKATDIVFGESCYASFPKTAIGYN